MRQIVLMLVLGVCCTSGWAKEGDGWYTEGNFVPEQRIRLTVTNTLAVDRAACHVVVKREDLPVNNIPQRYITVVDPALQGNPEPSEEDLRKFSGYLIRKEEYGHYLEYQMDDIDKDGIWDELFFMIDLGARETRTIYLYIGQAERGLYIHQTHAGIGYYGRHIVPFWESEYLGWKLWFPTSIDMHGKITPMLTAYPEYQRNLSGYYMPPEYGSDIMTVSTTFGAGGIGVSEVPADPDSVTRPMYNFRNGEGPYESPRFSYDVVVNGPLRSMIRARTMNWNSGSGFYEYELLLTSYAGKSYSTCQVAFTTFHPLEPKTMFVCGMREIMNEYDSEMVGGAAISFGKDIEVRTPDEDIDDEGMFVTFEGIAIAVKDEYRPEYRNIKRQGGNHIFRLPVTDDKSFEFMIMGGWSKGPVNRTADEFRTNVQSEVLGYKNPSVVKVYEYEAK